MKKLLLMLKLKPGETPEQFAKRYWQALKDKGYVDEKNKFKALKKNNHK